MACPEYKTEKSPCSTSTVDGWISEACLLFCSASQPGEVIWRLIAEGEERGCGEDHFITFLAKKDTAISHALDSLPDPKEITVWAQLPYQ